MKSRTQTSENSNEEWLKKHTERMEKEEAERLAALADVEGFEPVPDYNPTPQIPIYIRPVMNKDVSDMLEIYNDFAINSNIPEYQEPITEEQMLKMIEISRQDKDPWLVAIHGQVPRTVDAQGRRGPKSHFVPQHEMVLGFSFAETFNYGWAGKRNGRSRFNANMNLYGMSLCLHRILQIPILTLVL